MIDFCCSSCGVTLNVKDELANRKAKCPKCSTKIMIPQGASQYPQIVAEPQDPTPSDDPFGLRSPDQIFQTPPSATPEPATPPPVPVTRWQAQAPRPTQPKKTRKGVQFEQATTGDILLSILLPGWGIALGLLALMKSEYNRAGQMIFTGVVGNTLMVIAGSCMKSM